MEFGPRIGTVERALPMRFQQKQSHRKFFIGGEVGGGYFLDKFSQSQSGFQIILSFFLGLGFQILLKLSW